MGKRINETNYRPDALAGSVVMSDLHHLPDYPGAPFYLVIVKPAWMTFLVIGLEFYLPRYPRPQIALPELGEMQLPM